MPHQPTVIITPQCSCTRSCSPHHVDTVRCSADSFAAPAPRSAATQHLKSSRQHRRPVKDWTQDDECRYSSVDRREEQLRVASTKNDSCLRQRTVAFSTHDDDRCLSRANTSITQRYDDEPAIHNVDTEQPAVRPAWTARCRSQSLRDSKVDVPAKQAAARTANSRSLRDAKYNLTTSKVTRSACRDGRDTDHQQSAPDFATCTDQLTTNIYASLAAFQDDQENDVIDAVRGYLRSQPSPLSSRHHRRPPTGRRPATAADGRGSRTVQLRQGDVGPLSSLVVIRPATPQQRTSRINEGPPTFSNGQPKTAGGAVTASDAGHQALWCDGRRDHQQQQQQQQQQQLQQQQQHFVVRTSSRTTATCKSQSLNNGSVYDDGAWFSTVHCKQ